MKAVYKPPLRTSKCEECIFYSRILKRCMLPPIRTGKVKHCSELGYVEMSLEHNGELEVEACLPNVEIMSKIFHKHVTTKELDDFEIWASKILELGGCNPVFRMIEEGKVRIVLSCKCIHKVYVYCSKGRCSMVIQ